MFRYFEFNILLGLLKTFYRLLCLARIFIKNYRNDFYYSISGFNLPLKNRFISVSKYRKFIVRIFFIKYLKQLIVFLYNYIKRYFKNVY